MTRYQKMGAMLSALLLGGSLLTLSQHTDAQQPEAIEAKAPELVGGTGQWLNTPKNQPIKLANRKGKVTVVEFWTFG